MAALPLCAPPPTAVAMAVSRRISRGAVNFHPLGLGLGPSPAPVKLQQQARARRDSFRCHCDKRPDPEPENLHDPDKNYPLVEELLNRRRAIFAAMGRREPPDMFLKEKKQISYYMRTRKKSSKTDTRNLNENVMADIVCSTVQQALDLASRVMDIAHDGPGTIQFSQHTIDQMVRTYANILYNVAEDAYHKKIGIETFLSFLGALRGLGSIHHILAQDTVDKLKDRHLKNKITHHMDTLSQEFHKKVNNLEDEVARMKEQKLQQVAKIFIYGHGDAYAYILQLNHALDEFTPKE